MRTAITAVNERFGEINGVVHAAGVAGAGLVQLKTDEAVAAVTRPKAIGILVLESVLAAAKLDFIALFSSELAICPTVGQADYCAANAFLDAYAHYKSARGSVPVFSINWSAWQWDAWQSGQLATLGDLQRRIREFRSKFGISFDEGAEAFERILHAGLPQVAVATVELGRATSISPVMKASATVEAHTSVLVAPVARRSQTTEYAGPRSELERRLAELWAEGLGLDRVGIYDNFLEIGGHSLLAAQIISRLRDVFAAEISMNAFFEHPTVAAMASLLETAGGDSCEQTASRIEPAADAEVERQAVEEIDGLSDQELSQRLESMLGGQTE